MACRHIATSFFFISLVGVGLVGQAQAAMTRPSSPLAAAAPVPQDPSLTLTQVPNGYTLLHVNPAAGDDVTGEGGQMTPFKTITHALQVAGPNTIIVLSPGLYSAASGERFPIELRPGVTLQGAPSPNTANVTIQGSGSYLTPSQGLRHVTLLGNDSAGLANVTVSNPHPQGHGIWIENGSPVIVHNALVHSGATGIYIAGSGNPVIQGNYFFENGDAGLVVSGPSSAQIEGNVFENTGVGISVAPAATPQIVGNTISHNQEGLLLHGEARPQLRNNQIANNRRNSVLDYSPWPDAVPSAAVATIAPPPAAPAQVSTGDTAEPTVAVIPPTVESGPAEVAEDPANPAVAVIATPEAAITSLPESTFEPLSISTEPVVPDTTAVAAPEVVPSITTVEPLDIEASLTLPLVPELPNLPDDTIPIAVAPPAADTDNAHRVAATAENTAADLRSRLQQRNRTTELSSSSPDPAETAIDIPVIPAEPATQPETLAAAPLATPSAAPRGPISSDVLIVPGQNIPIGNGGSTPTIVTATIPAEDGPPPPPSRATILGLYYRVFVDANDEASQAQLEALIPDAFHVRVNGQPMMQAGAFDTLAEAQATADRLNQAGLRARVDYIP
jgi:parallel beta-helix repeat protein